MDSNVTRGQAGSGMRESLLAEEAREGCFAVRRRSRRSTGKTLKDVCPC